MRNNVTVFFLAFFYIKMPDLACSCNLDDSMLNHFCKQNKTDAGWEEENDTKTVLRWQEKK